MYNWAGGEKVLMDIIIKLLGLCEEEILQKQDQEVSFLILYQKENRILFHS
jgi:hypothetical protein